MPHGGPHLRVPFRITGGRALTVEDGSPDEIAQNVRVIVGTGVGERREVPDFGVDDPTFTDADLDDVEAAVAEFEPRADLHIERGPITETGEAEVLIRVSVR